MQKNQLFNLITLLTLLLFCHTTFHSYSQERIVKIKGKVIDHITENPISGVSLVAKKTKTSTRTDSNGEFEISLNVDKETIKVSYIGYNSKEISIKEPNRNIVISLESTTNSIDSVVVTGMFERKKESFTGTAVTIKGDDLRAIGNSNVIQSLRSLDPSFIILDNNLRGSDPNSLAQIELRGSTSVSIRNVADQFSQDPNQPLFILDGFEASLRQITDLDINRVKSVVILKDASATAIYGARSANGVIVVETIRPKEGKLMFGYTNSSLISFPDFSDYNLMNAKEKLEFERLSGLYKGNSASAFFLQRLYNYRLSEVTSGVDSYWLNEPTRTGFSQNHSINTSGGSENFQFLIGGNYQKNQGVMIGSERNNWGADVNVSYRKGSLTIQNTSFINGNKATNGNYSSFSDYARINPYYRKLNMDSRYLEALDVESTGSNIRRVSNDFYNSQLNSENSATSLQITNNLGISYNIKENWRINGNMQVSKGFNKAISFLSPQHTSFDNTPLLEKGRYSNTQGEQFNYSANLATTYSKTFNNHVLSTGFRGDISEISLNSNTFSVIGFPIGVKGNPSFGNQHIPNSKPSISTPPKIRRVNFAGTFNYIYDNKYFIDANYRLDGSTKFGTANVMSKFWSTGIGWNISKESFIKDKSNWIDRLTLRFNVGSTGNESFASYVSSDIYTIEAETNQFGQGFMQQTLGNPNLDWQKTLQTSIGLDFAFLNNRFSGTFGAYNKYTSPLIETIDLPTSSGLTSYPFNLGNLTIEGIETNLKFSPIYKLSEQIIWTINYTASMYRGKYNGFEEYQKNMNDELKKSNSLKRFIDNSSPYDLWAIKSLGIDPTTGEEMFVKLNGEYTYSYDDNEIQKVGSSRPLIEGIIGTNFKYKSLTLNVALRYNLGASRFNHALFNRVENISDYSLQFNQDKRALEMRWKNPGDIAQFRAISLTSNTPISSRFLQKENIFTGESFSLSYELLSRNNEWLKSIKLNSLRLIGYTNNIFRLSNIVNERGIDYPFARTVSLSINASF